VRAVKVGDTKEQVRQALGRPSGIIVAGNFDDSETWAYGGYVDWRNLLSCPLRSRLPFVLVVAGERTANKFEFLENVTTEVDGLIHAVDKHLQAVKLDLGGIARLGKELCERLHLLLLAHRAKNFGPFGWRRVCDERFDFFAHACILAQAAEKGFAFQVPEQPCQKIVKRFNHYMLFLTVEAESFDQIFNEASEGLIHREDENAVLPIVASKTSGAVNQYAGLAATRNAGQEDWPGVVLIDNPALIWVELDHPFLEAQGIMQTNDLFVRKIIENDESPLIWLRPEYLLRKRGGFRNRLGQS
jgi:hypothetical protein